MSLRLLTFGRTQVFAHGREVEELPAQRLRCGLLVYLLLEADVSRETLLGLFWPDRTPQRARHALSQTLYELRRALGDEWLILSGDRLRVEPGQVEVDALLFEECAAADPEGALQLYRGAFLEDFSPDVRGLEPWVSRQRARLARLHRKVRRDVLERLVAAGDAPGAQACARRWAELEPFDDEAHHRLIEVLAAQGHRAEAIQLFEAYQRRLREELEVEPLEETRALVAGLRDGAAGSAGSEPAGGAAPTLAVSTPGASEASEAGSSSGSGRLAALVTAFPGAGTTQAPVAASGRSWRRRSRWLALPLLLLPLLLWLGSRLRERPLAPAPSVSLRSIAVLVFDDGSPDRHLGFLTRGLTKDLIYQLSQVPGLDVVSFNGVAPLAGREISPDSLRRLLNVGSFVEGTVEEAGGRLSVIVSLTNAATGRVLRTARLERSAGDAIALEDDLAAEVSTLLRQVLGQALALQEHRAHARDATAWSLWLRSDELRDRALAVPEPNATGTLDARLLASADSLAAEAQRRDRAWVEPTLLRGWLALDLSRADVAHRAEWLAKALEHAERALEQAPHLPRAYELRGALHMAVARAAPPGSAPLPLLLDSAEADLRAAVAGEPTLAGAWSTLSDLLERRGRFVEASQAAEEALRRDAFLQQGADVVTRMYYGALTLERWDDAQRWCARGRHDYPTHWSLLDCPLTLLALRPGRPDPDSAWARLRTIQALEPAGAPELGPSYRNIFRRMMVALVLARAGRPDSARALIAAAQSAVADSADLRTSLLYDEARVRLQLGERERALQLLTAYVRARPELRGYVRSDFSWRPLRPDPRFRALVADGVAARTP